MRTKIIASIAVITGLITVVLLTLGRSPAFVVGVGGLAMFVVFLLWDLPPKHKEFTYEDQLKGAARGGGGPPKLPEPDIPRRRKGK